MGLLEDARRRVILAKLRRNLERGSDPFALDPGMALDATRNATSILFLCHGNVCRSPMAERYLQLALRSNPVVDLEVDSAGFVETAGRSSPARAVRAAREHDVDLADHRSKRVTESLVSSVDVVFLMDVRNYARFDQTFGSTTTTPFFLAPLAPGGTDSFEVPDPYGGDLDGYRRTYGQVAGALDVLVDGLERGDE